MQADEFENPADLHLDLKNPRMTDGAFENEDDMLEYLVDHTDVDELLQSILNSGWLDYEPLIVAGDIVPEGNRRLAALRILSNETLRERLRIDLPFEPNSGALPESVRVRRVGTRSVERCVGSERRESLREAETSRVANGEDRKYERPVRKRLVRRFESGTIAGRGDGR